MAITAQHFNEMPAKEYKRRIWAWTMYDWANSAFATTILAAVLPVYFSKVAAANLPSTAQATATWSTGLSISLLIVAILSPILGTVSDVARSKKRLLSIFAALGVLSTAFLVLVERGDWVLASILAILGRIGFNGSLTFYDALLPHIARPEDQDNVSARGYAFGYLGGGLLLAINVVMIQFLPGTWGARLSFLSVAIWWAIFTLPILLIVPEPAASRSAPDRQGSILAASFKRLWTTLRDIRQYRDLFKYLLAFLIYNDGIGTIIGVAAIYGAELGFEASELILALLLVQFAGIPYSLIFGRLPEKTNRRRPVFLAFVLFNLVALPLCGIIGARVFPVNMTGAPVAPYTSTETAYGEGSYVPGKFGLELQGDWSLQTASQQETRDVAITYAASTTQDDRVQLRFYGQKFEVYYNLGPDYGIWRAELDGQPLLDPDTGQALALDTYNSTLRYNEGILLVADQPGEHLLTVINTGQANPDSQGTRIAINAIKVLPPIRQSNLMAILGMILAVEVIGLALSFAVGDRLFSRWVGFLDTRNSIQLALVVYAVVAVWGFFLDSVIEFWFLAWMVAVVQGGSQALSRSLYAALSPSAKSGEFFGLFSIMEKFSSLIGPLLFAGAALAFQSSRPAVLALVLPFLVGGLLLRGVNVERGRQVAQAEDQSLASQGNYVN